MVDRSYQVEFSPGASRQIEKFNAGLRQRLLNAIRKLSANPRPSGAAKLAGHDSLWRIRIGQHRVVYEIHDRILRVLIVRIGHRKDIYRKP